MLKTDEILIRVNKRTIDKPILNVRINSIQIETLAVVLIEEINAEIAKIIRLNNLITPS